MGTQFASQGISAVGNGVTSTKKTMLKTFEGLKNKFTLPAISLPSLPALPIPSLSMSKKEETEEEIKTPKRPISLDITYRLVT